MHQYINTSRQQCHLNALNTPLALPSDAKAQQYGATITKIDQHTCNIMHHECHGHALSQLLAHSMAIFLFLSFSATSDSTPSISNARVVSLHCDFLLHLSCLSCHIPRLLTTMLSAAATCPALLVSLGLVTSLPWEGCRTHPASSRRDLILLLPEAVSKGILSPVHRSCRPYFSCTQLL